MPGTREGGLKASKTNKIKYGVDFYKNIGAEGGKRSKHTGFAINGHMASLAGKIGGIKSANRRYGTPIDNDKLNELERELKILKTYKGE